MHRLSEENSGVPPDLLDQMWSKGEMLWEPNKVRNSILPYSTRGSGIEAVFDGIAEWSYILSSQQVTVYDHSPKLGHFDIRSIRRTLWDESNFRISEENSETVTVIVDGADQSNPALGRREVRLGKSSGFILFETDHGGTLLHEHYEGGIQDVDASSPGIQFPIVSANVIFRGEQLFQAQLFLVDNCRLNHKIEDAEYALSVPAGTNVFYSGDMRPGEDTAKRHALAHIMVRAGLEDVRILLPELRSKYELQAGRVDIHVGSPLAQHGVPPTAGNWTMVLAVNAIVAIVLGVLWFIRARRRAGTK